MTIQQRAAAILAKIKSDCQGEKKQMALRVAAGAKSFESIDAVMRRHAMQLARLEG